MSKFLQRIKYLVLAAGLVSGVALPASPGQAAHCPNLKIIFARGSGGERYGDQNYLAFKGSLETKLLDTGLDYEFEDLDYPAVGVGVDNLWVTLGAFFGSGEAYEFGRSVNTGVLRLIQTIKNDTCPNTKYVIAGYSQGAMVVSRALSSLNADKIIYAATFGDPKIYLPEGRGILPGACRGENLSNYRVYVPDCQAYEGLLGSYRPYQPETYLNKLGTWCNKMDIFCSSHFSVSNHVSYVEDNLYEDAARLIFRKIAAEFESDNHFHFAFTSPHDTAFLIDSTASMDTMIDRYKAEALKLAEQTLAAGGRVALYDYRDVKYQETPREHCSFETCTLASFRAGLEAIEMGSGGDLPESVLSASFHVMKKLEWKLGSTKSMVILTDAGYHSPDLDGTTFTDVVELSKQIDPVNFYVITNRHLVDTYTELATATDGMVITLADAEQLTGYILERSDSLPRVEENVAVDELPVLSVDSVTELAPDTIEIKYQNTGSAALVILNDAVLGLTSEQDFTIQGLNRNLSNEITLVPLSDNRRGERVSIINALETPSLAADLPVAAAAESLSTATPEVEDLRASAPIMEANNVNDNILPQSTSAPQTLATSAKNDFKTDVPTVVLEDERLQAAPVAPPQPAHTLVPKAPNTGRK